MRTALAQPGKGVLDYLPPGQYPKATPHLLQTIAPQPQLAVLRQVHIGAVDPRGQDDPVSVYQGCGPAPGEPFSVVPRRSGRYG